VRKEKPRHPHIPLGSCGGVFRAGLGLGFPTGAAEPPRQQSGTHEQGRGRALLPGWGRMINFSGVLRLEHTRKSPAERGRKDNREYATLLARIVEPRTWAALGPLPRKEGSKPLRSIRLFCVIFATP
jgi:hypothetical protein